MRTTTALFALFFVLPGGAYAFDDASQFFASTAVPHASSLSASSEGFYFTGAPRFAKLDCAKCHTSGPGRLTMHLGASPSTLFTDGYDPGATYEIEVALGNESRGLQYNASTCTEPPGPTDQYTYVQCNNNGFALELDGRGGATPGVGTICAGAPAQGACPTVDPFLDETVVAPGGDAIFSNRQHSPVQPKQVVRNGATYWHFYWVAPAAGTGAVTVFGAAVDGNGGAGTADNDQDPDGDDTVHATVVIPEHGARRSGGCALAGPSDAAAGTVWLWAAWLVSCLVSALRTGASPKGPRRRARLSFVIARTSCPNPETWRQRLFGQPLQNVR